MFKKKECGNITFKVVQMYPNILFNFVVATKVYTNVVPLDDDVGATFTC